MKDLEKAADWVPARIIAECETSEQIAKAEELFIYAYASCPDESIAWANVELQLFGYSL